MHHPLQRYLALLATYLRPLWPQTLLLTVLLVTSTGFQFLNPQILRYFIDTALVGGTTTSLLIAATLFIAIALANSVVSVVATALTVHVSWKSTNRLRTDLLAHCLSLDMGFHNTRTPGEFIERIDGDVDTLSNFFSQFTIQLLTNLLLLSGVLVLFFTIDWRVGVTMMTYAGVTYVMLMYLRRRAIPRWAAWRQMSATFFGFLSELFTATVDIQANGATAYIMRQFFLLLRRLSQVYRKSMSVAFTMDITARFLFTSGSILALASGLYLWSIHSTSVGTVYLLFAYTNLLAQPLEQIQTQLQDLQQVEACIQRVEELLHMSSALREGNDLSLPTGALPVEFRQVSFGYAAHTPVIQNLTFVLQPGKVLGVLGRTGSGKTTLARLLFRLYEPQAGEILVGDIPISSPSLHVLRQHIGMVTQEVQLFHATVRDNLTFFNRAIPDARIVEVLDTVGLSAWYQSLPLGLDTMLGPNSEGLSAGEAQLLAFARVFLSNPGVVILDEASSRLDPATESLIQQATTNLLHGRTAIVIAHRLSTVQRADDILLVEDGRMLEYGDRATLANNPDSRFFSLLQTGLEEVYA